MRLAVAAMNLKAIAAVRLADPVAERARDSHAQAIVELQQLPAAALKVIRAVALPNGGSARIAHGLGREPLAVLVSPPYASGTVVITAGLVSEYRGTDAAGAPIDRTQTIVLVAGGFGVAINVDVVVL